MPVQPRRGGGSAARTGGLDTVCPVRLRTERWSRRRYRFDRHVALTRGPRPMRLRPAPRLLIAGLMALTLGCEGRTSGFLTTGPTSNVRVRLINALTSSQSLDLVLDAQVAASGVGFGTASQYASTTEGTHQLQAR